MVSQSLRSVAGRLAAKAKLLLRLQQLSKSRTQQLMQQQHPGGVAGPAAVRPKCLLPLLLVNRSAA
jgi:hypothetical protein